MDEYREKRRSANFSPMEVEVLMEIIAKNKIIIENKSTDKMSANEKAAAWLEIEKEFNSISGCIRRPAATLKKKYENLKKTSRYRYAKEKNRLYTSGGGLAQKTNKKSVDEMLHDILGNQIDGLPSVYDSDFVQPSQEDSDEIDVKPICSSRLISGNENPSIEEASVPFNVSDTEEIDVKPTCLTETINGTENTSTEQAIAPFCISDTDEIDVKPSITELIGKKGSPSKEHVDIPSGDGNYRGAKKKRLLKNATACDKWKELADLKIKIAMEKLDNIREIHSLQIMHMKEEHDLKIKILEAQLLSKQSE